MNKERTSSPKRGTIAAPKMSLDDLIITLCNNDGCIDLIFSPRGDVLSTIKTAEKLGLVEVSIAKEEVYLTDSPMLSAFGVTFHEWNGEDDET